MDKNNVFSYLDNNYKFLNNYIKDLNESIFITPDNSIIKGRTYAEKLSQEISRNENIGLLTDLSQYDRLKRLENLGFIDGEIKDLFHDIRKIGNQVAHNGVEGELELALRIHKDIYKITCWFVKKYIEERFEAEPYETPMPLRNESAKLDENIIQEIIKRTMESYNDKIPQTGNNQFDITNSEISASYNKDIEEAHTDMVLEDILSDEIDKKCLVQELSKLKESSKEAVEGLNEFTPFKKYMHIVRNAQSGLEELILKANNSDKAQLILVCGSVGDGKSHIISFFNNRYPEVMSNFVLHNDATESLEPNKTSMDTLNDVLDEFSDEKIDSSKQKFILAINLGTLNNFIDSKYGERFTKLKKFVQDKKILENSIEDSSFDEESSFQFVNFSDYHIFTLKDGKVRSDYVKSLIQRITRSYEIELHERNIFFASYKKHCRECENINCCPIKANYELLSRDNVQDSIVELLVQCIVKDKIIISTRALLNFMYELIVPRSYVDVNSPTFKSKIKNLKTQEYIKALMPNIIFDHKELSFIFEALNNIDPLNVRNEKVDDFIIDFNNATNLLDYFKEYIDFPKGFLDKLNETELNESEAKNKIRYELLKLFIRSYYMCGKGEIFSLRDNVYDEYMNAVFNWNRGDKAKLKDVYNNVREGIINWNGEADKDHINIFMGKNQIKYKVSEKIELKVDTSNLPSSDEDDLKKFIDTLKLKYRSQNSETPYEIILDYNLYKLLIQVNNGYRPNKKDKNHFIKFVEFINKLEEAGSQNEELLFTEKNRENNKQFKLEYDEEFETYRFVEI